MNGQMLDTLLLRVQYQTCCPSMCDCSATGRLLLVDVIAHSGGGMRRGERSEFSFVLEVTANRSTKKNFTMKSVYVTNSICIYAIFCVFKIVSATTTCNEAICGPIVSKCTLLKSCECEVTDTANWSSCIRKCYACLDYLQADCCSCFKGLCKKNETEITNSLAKRAKSLIGEIPIPTPMLWDALMGGENTPDQR